MGILLLLCSCLFPCADTPGRGARGWGMHGIAVKPGHSSVGGERRQTFSIPVCALPGVPLLAALALW